MGNKLKIINHSASFFVWLHQGFPVSDETESTVGSTFPTTSKPKKHYIMKKKALLIVLTWL